MPAEKVFEGLPKWAQGVIAVVSLGGLVFLGWRIYATVQDRTLHAGDYKQQDDVKSDLSTLSTANVKPTLTDSQFDAYANQLFTAMDGYGHDFNSIIRVFINMVNDADVLKLIDAYGIREVSSGRLNTAPNFKGTLSGAITDECSPDEIAQINIALAKRKIKIKF